MHARGPRFSLVAGLAAAVVAILAAVPQPAEAQIFSYSVKFVCGFTKNNIGFDDFGNLRGEGTVKGGNYATDINILNPDTAFGANVTKRVFVLYNGLLAIPPVGREPLTVPPTGAEAIALPAFRATMDDCNKLYTLLGIALVNPPPLVIGFLSIRSNRVLDVTAVYTAEICTDWTLVGSDFMCSDPNSGGGLSIHVEQINERRF